MKINKICLSLFIYLGYTVPLYAENSTGNNSVEEGAYFDPDFLELPNKDAVDLSQFENNQQFAGSYYVDIYVNTNLIGA
jgi:outer membrane usher protein